MRPCCALAPVSLQLRTPRCPARCPAGRAVPRRRLAAATAVAAVATPTRLAPEVVLQEEVQQKRADQPLCTARGPLKVLIFNDFH